MGGISMNYFIEPIFSSPICRFSTENYNFNKLEKLREYPFTPIGTDGDNGTYITLNKYVLEDFPEEKMYFMEMFNTFKNELLRYEKTNFRITTSWGTCIKPEKYSHNHCHKNCMFSGVFYLKNEESLAPIIFDSFGLTDSFKIVPSEYNIFNCKEWKINPKPGEFIIFPSYVFHRIGKSSSKTNRFSLAMNFHPTGKIGEEDSTVIY